MSYLTTPDLPEFGKAVISFWFKVSQADLDAVQKEEDDWYDAHKDDTSEDPDPPPPLLGRIPLLVFGKEGTSEKHPKEHNSPTWHTETHTTHGCADMNPVFSGGYPETCVSFEHNCSDGSYETHWSEVSVSYSTTGGKPTEPSYIAVSGGGEAGASGRLRINFESATIADYSGNCGLLSGSSDHVTSGSSSIDCHYPVANGSCASDPLFPVGGLYGILLYVLGLIALHVGTAVADVCEVGGGGNEHVKGEFKVGAIPGDRGSGAINWSGGDVKGDTWHHVLISVDMTGGGVSSGGTYSSSSTLYVAIDDTDIKTGSYPFEGTNKVVPGGSNTSPSTGGDCPEQTYSLTNMTVPSAPLGIPCVAKYADKIRQVEMAELLFFIGVTLDTSEEQNRRHFITGKGEDGSQRPTNTWPLFIPMRKFAVGDPFYWEDGADNPAFAPPLFDPSSWPTGIKGLGNADVDLTKCAWNWQMGRNLGKLRGKIEKTGKIKEYDPTDPPKVSAG